MVLSPNTTRLVSSEKQGEPRAKARGGPLFFRNSPAHKTGGGACPERSEGTGVGVDTNAT
jgi:hypothetical protein